MKQPKYAVFILLTVLGLVADQATKIWTRASAQMQTREGIEVIPGFMDFVHAENPGAAFGMLGSVDPWIRVSVFVIFTLVAVGVMLKMFWELRGSDWYLSAALGLALSGALGNLIDRIMKQTVTDFIRVYTEYEPLASFLNNTVGLGGHRAGVAEWPTFNIADATLLIGVGMGVLHYLFVGEEDEEEEDEAAPAEPSTPSEPDDIDAA